MILFLKKSLHKNPMTCTAKVVVAFELRHKKNI